MDRGVLKRIVGAGIAALMILSLTGCAGDAKDGTVKDGTVKDATVKGGLIPLDDRKYLYYMDYNDRMLSEELANVKKYDDLYDEFNYDPVYYSKPQLSEAQIQNMFK